MKALEVVRLCFVFSSLIIQEMRSSKYEKSSFGEWLLHNIFKPFNSKDHKTSIFGGYINWAKGICNFVYPKHVVIDKQTIFLTINKLIFGFYLFSLCVRSLNLSRISHASLEFFRSCMSPIISLKNFEELNNIFLSMFHFMFSMPSIDLPKN